jgi:4-amino-4-deoxy-L-arabinose transferase-like glycosyltransferase
MFFLPLSPPDKPGLQSRLFFLLGILAVAFLPRLLFVFQWQTTPFGAMPYLDAAAYDSWAQSILAGQGWGERAFYQSPLFPYVLAGLYGIFGHSLVAVGLFNVALGAGACALLALAARESFGLAAGILTGLLAAFYEPFIFYAAPVMKETLVIFLLAGFLLHALRALKENRSLSYLWAGLWLGFGVLTRGNVLLVGFAFLLLAGWQYRCHAWKTAAVFLLGMGLVIAPVTLHNAVASDDFVPITYSGGFNLFIGNRDGANGANAYPSDIPTGLMEEQVTTQKAEAARGRKLKPSEVSAYWQEQALDFIVRHPDQAAGLALKKLGFLFSHTEFPDNYNVDFFSRHMGTLLQAPLPGFALVLGLVCFVLAASNPAQRRLLMPWLVLAAGYVLSVLPFYVTDRYRLPLLVFLLPVAGAAFPLAQSLIAGRAWPRLVAADTLALLAIITSLTFPLPSPTNTAMGWLTLSDIQLRLGHSRAALQSLDRAMALAPRDIPPFMRERREQLRNGNDAGRNTINP